MKKTIGKRKRLSSMIAFMLCFIMLTPTVALGKFDSESAGSLAQIGLPTKEIVSSETRSEKDYKLLPHAANELMLRDSILFCSPFVLGIYVTAMPRSETIDHSERNQKINVIDDAIVSEEVGIFKHNGKMPSRVAKTGDEYSLLILLFSLLVSSISILIIGRISLEKRHKADHLLCKTNEPTIVRYE